jgi:hypothetical protein
MPFFEEIQHFALFTLCLIVAATVAHFCILCCCLNTDDDPFHYELVVMQPRKVPRLEQIALDAIVRYCKKGKLRPKRGDLPQKLLLEIQNRM